MDRWFDSLGLGRMSQRLGPMENTWSGPWAPELETFMRGDQFIIRMDLPGLKTDDVNVEVTDDSIVIHGERQQSREDSREGWYRSERSYGQFRREVLLPEGAQPDTAKGNFRDGVLEVSIKASPRQTAKPRRIEIGTRGATEGENLPREGTAEEGRSIHGERPTVAHERK
jgi:HSP20 family protein